ncbi:MAG TPA: hypothetical protein VFW47_06215 [Phenylobacterium sp.]|nr:hypothetical protein [Phenylobacterium sp.]
MIKRLAVLGVLLLSSACATTQGPPPPAVARATPPTAEFRPSDFAWSTVAGGGRIQGQLSYRPGGKRYSCADSGVLLTPETPWTRRRMEILYTSAEHAALPAGEVRGRTPPGRSGDYSAFVKRATCDSTGRFSFEGLADGAWFVITVAKPATSGAGPDMAIMRRVVVRGGRAVAVSL